MTEVEQRDPPELAAAGAGVEREPALLADRLRRLARLKLRRLLADPVDRVADRGDEGDRAAEQRDHQAGDRYAVGDSPGARRRRKSPLDPSEPPRRSPARRRRSTRRRSRRSEARRRERGPEFRCSRRGTGPSVQARRATPGARRAQAMRAGERGRARRPRRRSSAAAPAIIEPRLWLSIPMARQRVAAARAAPRPSHMPAGRAARPSAGQKAIRKKAALAFR